MFMTGGRSSSSSPPSGLKPIQESSDGGDEEEDLPPVMNMSAKFYIMTAGALSAFYTSYDFNILRRHGHIRALRILLCKLFTKQTSIFKRVLPCYTYRSLCDKLYSIHHPLRLHNDCSMHHWGIPRYCQQHSGVTISDDSRIRLVPEYE